MKKYISLFLLLSGTGIHTLCAQNLVPNGGFEEVIECPVGTDALHFGCANWFKSIQIPGNEMHENPSPDWYHGCSSNPVFSPPNVAFSYQEPYEGEGMAAIIMYASNQNNYREIIGVQLTQPLNVGETYLVEFYISWGYFDIGSLKSNNQGVKFSREAIFESATDVVNNYSHFKMDTLITDSVSWLDVSFQFTADSAYEYIHVGNFYRDEFTLTETTEEGFNIWAYYFIDNVSVQSALSILENTPMIDVYPNPVNSFLIAIIPTNIERYIMYDVNGRIVDSDFGSFENELRIDVSMLNAGLYMLHLRDENGKWYRKKILKQ